MHTWSAAFKVGVSCETWPTSTDSSMIASLTISISCTITWINTLFIAACKCCWALRICQAFIGFAFNIGTALMSRWTLTPSPMTIYSAESFYTTLLKWARILAFLLDASLSQRTLIITFTSS